MSNDANTLKKRQEIKKYLVYAGMFLLFIGCMWWIFAPSKEDRQEETKKAGFNTELPDPRGAGIEGDKIAAYEHAGRLLFPCRRKKAGESAGCGCGDCAGFGV